MSAYEVFSSACYVVALVFLARFLWRLSESQLNCEEHLKQIAEGLEDQELETS